MCVGWRLFICTHYLCVWMKAYACYGTHDMEVRRQPWMSVSPSTLSETKAPPLSLMSSIRVAGLRAGDSWSFICTQESYNCKRFCWRDPAIAVSYEAMSSSLITILQDRQLHPSYKCGNWGLEVQVTWQRSIASIWQNWYLNICLSSRFQVNVLALHSKGTDSSLLELTMEGWKEW